MACGAAVVRLERRTCQAWRRAEDLVKSPPERSRGRARGLCRDLLFNLRFTLGVTEGKPKYGMETSSVGAYFTHYGSRGAPTNFGRDMD